MKTVQLLQRSLKLAKDRKCLNAIELHKEGMVG